MRKRRGVADVKNGVPIMFSGTCLILSYLFTGALLMLLAFLLYQFELSAEICSGGVIVIYIMANLLSGFLTGRRMGTGKFAWGLGMGIAYFVILAVVSLCVNHSTLAVANDFLTTFLLCAGSGMLGGMLS